MKFYAITSNDVFAKDYYIVAIGNTHMQAYDRAHSILPIDHDSLRRRYEIQNLITVADYDLEWYGIRLPANESEGS